MTDHVIVVNGLRLVATPIGDGSVDVTVIDVLSQTIIAALQCRASSQSETSAVTHMGRIVRFEAIMNAVALAFGIPRHTLHRRCRRRPYSIARFVAMWLIKKHSNETLDSIGDMFGGRDHTTVLHGINQVDRMRHEDPKFAALIADIETKILLNKPPQQEPITGA